MNERVSERELFRAQYSYHVRFDLLTGACVTLHEYAATPHKVSRSRVAETRALTAYDLVSSAITTSGLHVTYVSLHAPRAVTVDSMLRGTESARAAGTRLSVTRTRANPVFINSFTRHGKKERALGGYAKSLAMIMLIFRRARYGELQLLRTLWQRTAPVSSGFVDCVAYNAALQLQGENVRALNIGLRKHAVKELALSDQSVAGSELLQRNLLYIAPAYSVKISRIPKKRYKNLRGKTSRMEVREVPVRPASALSYWRRQMRYVWSVSWARTYQAKFADTLSSFLLAPGKTAGYRIARKTYFKKKRY